MSELFLFCVNRAIPAGILVLAVLLLRLLPKLPKRVFPILWGIVGLRLLLPCSLETVVSLIPSAKPVPADIMTAPVPVVESGFGILNSAVNPALSASLAPNPGDSANPMQVWVFVLSVLWLCGLAAMLLYLLASTLLLRRKLRFAVSLRDNLWQSENVSSPFVFGVINPRIYLPFSMTEDEISAVEAHEDTHIRRHDPLSKLIGYLLLSVFWFQPLLWVAYHVFCRDIELACDEAAVTSLSPDARAAYSEALLSCSLSGQKHRPVCPLAFGEVDVKHRVKSILSYKKPAAWVTAVCVLLCIGFAVCFLTNPVGSYHENGPFGHTYRASETVYLAPAGYQPPDGEIYYSFDSSGRLSVMESPNLLNRQAGWETLGQFSKTRLTKTNFDARFTVWEHPELTYADAVRLRENTVNAWQLVTADKSRMYYDLLETKDGSLYLTLGYWNVDSVDGYGSPIRCVVRLEETEVLTCTVESGEAVTIIEPLYCPQISSISYDALPAVSFPDTLGTVKIRGASADAPESIRVSEDYYHALSADAVTIEKMTFTLFREKDGSYPLPLAHRNPKQAESAVYYILYNGKRYVFKVLFPAVSD